MEQNIQTIPSQDGAESVLRTRANSLLTRFILSILFIALLVVVIVILSFEKVGIGLRVIFLSSISMIVLWLGEMFHWVWYRKAYRSLYDSLIQQRDAFQRGIVARQVDGLTPRPDVGDFEDVEKEIIVQMKPKSRRAVTLQVTSIRRAEPKVIHDPPDVS